MLLENATSHSVEELNSDDDLIIAMNLPPNSTEKETNLESKLKSFNLKNTVQILATSWDKISMSNIRKSSKALLEFGSEWYEEDSMPLNILQKILQQENEDLTTIGTLAGQIVIEHIFTNADIHNWIQEEFHVKRNDDQVKLSNTETGALYDS